MLDSVSPWCLYVYTSFRIILFIKSGGESGLRERIIVNVFLF